MGIVSIYLHFPFYNNRLIFLFIPLLRVPSLLICKTCPPFWKQVYMKVRLHHCMLSVKHLSAISHLFPVYSGSSQQPALSLVFAYLKTHYLHLLSLKNARSQFGIIPRKNTTFWYKKNYENSRLTRDQDGQTHCSCSLHQGVRAPSSTLQTEEP